MDFTLSALLNSPYTLLGAIAILFIVAGIFIVNLPAMARIRSSREVIEESRHQAREASEVILNQARQEAQHILLKANERAAELLRNADFVKSGAEKEIEQALRKFSQEEINRLTETYQQLTGSYRVMAEEANRSYLKSMEVASQQLFKDSQESTGQFRSLLQEEITRFHTAIDQRLSGWLSGAQQEIDTYKKARLHQVDDAIFRILYIVSEQVLGKAIDIEKHQVLVMHALEGAKREGFFRIP